MFFFYFTAYFTKRYIYFVFCANFIYLSELKLYYKYKLLIIDEVGFNEITELEAKLFFHLVDMRYEKRSTIITSNITFEKWPQILGNDEMITKAILDRLLHHSYLFNITDPSYRIKDKLKHTIKKLGNLRCTFLGILCLTFIITYFLEIGYFNSIKSIVLVYP